MSDGYFDSDDMNDHGFESAFGGGIFQQFFGGGRASRRQSSRKSETTVLPLRLSLEDCFNGKNTKLLIKRKRICQQCNGTGSKSGRSHTCSTCRGRGRVIRVQQLGPCMMTQSEGICDDCRGRGEAFAEGDICEECNGNKVTLNSKTVEVSFPCGSCEGTNVKLRGEGDQYPGMEPGDIIIKVEQKPHDLYKCVRGDLQILRTVTITESLCGAKFPLKRLDNTTMMVSAKAPIKDGDVRIIPKEGMPSSEQPRGDLYIQFSVEFPENNYASVEDILKLKSLLGGNKKKIDFSGAQEVDMVDFVEPTRFAGATMSDDEDEGHFRGHRTTQCSSQ